MSDVAVAPNGDIYVTAVAESKVRKISLSTGNVTDVNVGFSKYAGLGMSASGRLYLVDTNAGTLLRETGANTNAFTQLASGLSSPRDVAIAADNTAYVTTGRKSSHHTGDRCWCHLGLCRNNTGLFRGWRCGVQCAPEYPATDDRCRSVSIKFSTAADGGYYCVPERRYLFR
jgi:hypothetical protein